MNARHWLGLLAGLCCLVQTLPASAFCLTHGCNDATQDCDYDGNGCLSSGPLLYWDSSCVSFDVQKDGSALRGLSYEATEQAIRDGFHEWLNADRNGEAPDIEISDFGPVECRTAEYNQDAGNANIFMFRDDAWPYENAIDTLALTTLIFNADTGQIYDADVEVNSFESAISIGDAGGIGHDDIDFHSVITHEIGHFLGLSHSSAIGATMRPSYAPGNTSMASIEPDDVAGICAALAPGRKVASSSCEPRHGFSTECSVADSGCSTTPGRSQRVPWLGGLMLAALSSRLWSRLRRAGRPSAAGPGPRSGLDSAS